MKILKISNELSKRILKRDTVIKHTNVEESNLDIVSFENGLIFYLCTDDFLFNLDKIDSVSPFLPYEIEVDSTKLVTGSLTNQVSIYQKEEYIKVETNNFYVLVKRKDLKYFESTCKFKIKSDNSEVFIYENNALVGRLATWQHLENKA